MRRGRLEDGDVLLYKDGAYIGRTSLVGRGFPHHECAVNEHVFRLRGMPDCLPTHLLYLWLSDDVTVQRVRSLNSNAAQPELNQRKLRELEVLLPSYALALTFEGMVEPVFSTALDLANSNRVLSGLRDLLLPKLVTGEIDVSGLDLDALTEAGTA